MSKIFSIFGYILCVVAAGLIILAFATPNWLEPDKGRQSIAKFEKIGLWEMCFTGMQVRLDSFGTIYNGCWWIFSREYDSIRKWLLPEWFVTTQALMTIALVFCLLGSLFGLMLLLGCFPEKLWKYIAASMAVGHYAIGVIVAAALICFGSNAEVDRTWLSNNSYRHLSWSFYMAVVGGVMALLSGMCYTVYFINIRKSGRNTTAYRAHELRHYRQERRGYY